ncbi:MAG: 30S ribosomal protein S7 [Alphaproteobacteria bacterium]|nr:30S ribosomal protein S7 [Alphaproteobacteria bacterium]MBL0718161.1 30S ribosomal protein S7 [Alphaproteobacteria bacterium]
MARRKRAEVRKIVKDPKYGSELISKFMNSLMLDGKKSVAEKTLYKALENIKGVKSETIPNTFEQIIELAKPLMEVKSRRVGGSNYQVPTSVRPARAQALSIRWIIDSSRKRPEKTMADRLAKEFSDILAGQGSTLKKKSDVQKMADANKVYSQYNW